jgi:hypothetical protein
MKNEEKKKTKTKERKTHTFRARHSRENAGIVAGM